MCAFAPSSLHHCQYVSSRYPATATTTSTQRYALLNKGVFSKLIFRRNKQNEHQNRTTVLEEQEQEEIPMEMHVLSNDNDKSPHVVDPLHVMTGANLTEYVKHQHEHQNSHTGTINKDDNDNNINDAVLLESDLPTNNNSNNKDNTTTSAGLGVLIPIESIVQETAPPLPLTVSSDSTTSTPVGMDLLNNSNVITGSGTARPKFLDRLMVPRKILNQTTTGKRKPYNPRPVFESFSPKSIKLPPLVDVNGSAIDIESVLSHLLPSLVNVSQNGTATILTMATNDTNSNGNNNNNPYDYFYDTKAALAFLDSHANFTKQQLDAAQKMLWETSANATKQLDSAQKALLEYGAHVLEEAAHTAAPKIINNKLGGGTSIIMNAHDLENYLRLNGYVRQTDLLQQQQARGNASTVVVDHTRKGGTLATTLPSPSSLTTAPSSSSSKSNRRVAFPQPSVLNYDTLKWASTVSAALLGLLGGSTIFPNLWLLGAIFGACYGYETSKDLSEQPASTNTVSRVVVGMGRRLAHQYLKGRDFVAGLWFMYKTGQLSYDYWKRYAALDQQFAIQSKVDAWNARFQEGKVKFDKWEQDNEVGRKVLAAVRTVWLVEEKSKKKTKYRVVKYFNNVTRYLRVRFLTLYSKRGKALQELQAFAEGMRQELADPSQWQEKVRPRIAAALAALTFVNLTGALFAASPLLLGFVSVVLGGIVWPTWFSEWLSKVGAFFEETKAMGKREGQSIFRTTLSSSGSASASGASTNRKQLSNDNLPKVLTLPFRSKQEKERYHFYRRPDGTKKWYRTGGNPWDANSNLSNIMWWRKGREESKPWWSMN